MENKVRKTLIIIAALFLALIATMVAACSSSTNLSDSSTSATVIASSTVDSSAVEAAADKKAADTRAAAVAAAKTKAAAAKAAADKKAAAKKAADKKAADAEASRESESSSAAQSSTTEPAPKEWYDSRGYVSPQTQQRALAAGIPWGGEVPGYLRCGTICGEEPTSGEVQSGWGNGDSTTPATTIPEDPSQQTITCADIYRGLGGGYEIRGKCYPSAAAASAAGEGE